MSYASWCKEHYPVPANDPTLNTEEKQLLHSLAKWRGLRDDKLDAHGLVRIGFMLKTKAIEDDEERHVADINAKSCALCVAYYCSICPLSRSRGDVACDGRTDEEQFPGGDSPWHAARLSTTMGVEPMIKALELAAEYIGVEVPQ